MSTSFVDFSVPFDESKLSFKKFNTIDGKGAVVYMAYGGKKIRVKTPSLTAPYGVSKPYGSRKRDGEDEPAKGGDDGGGSKSSIKVNLDTDEAHKMADWLSKLDEAAYAHILENAGTIFEFALKFSGPKLADKKKEAAAGFLNRSRIIKDEDLGKSMKINFPVEPSAVEIINKKGEKLTPDDVARESMVKVDFEIGGIFINGSIVAVQTRAKSILADHSGGAGAASTFADDLDEDAKPAAKIKTEEPKPSVEESVKLEEEEEEGAAKPAQKRKVEEEEDEGAMKPVQKRKVEEEEDEEEEEPAPKKAAPKKAAAKKKKVEEEEDEEDDE